MKDLFLKSRRIFQVSLLFLFVLSLTACDSDSPFCLIPFLCADAEVRHAVDTADPGECEKLSNPDDPNKELSRKNQCFQKVAEKLNDPTVCKMIVGDNVRWNNCFKSVAEGNQDETLCGEINDNDSLMQNCYTDVAISKGDADLCVKGVTTVNKNKCYKEVAVKNKDEGICNSIENDSIKNNCIRYVAIEKEDVKVCEKIADNPRTQAMCINEVAIHKNDPELCKQQIEEDWANDCYYFIATESENSDICSRINDEDDENDCYREIANKKSDPEICNFIINENDRTACYSKIGINTADLSVCDRIIGDNSLARLTRSDCYIGVIEKTGEGEMCMSMNVTDLDKQTCLVKASLRSSDSGFCSNLESNEDKYTCAFNVAYKTQEARHCGLVFPGNQGTRERCIHNIAVKFKDPIVCETVTDLNDRAICLESLKYNQEQK